MGTMPQSAAVALSHLHISKALIDSDDTKSLDFSHNSISDIPDDALSELALLANGVALNGNGSGTTNEGEQEDLDGSGSVHRRVITFTTYH